jgi:hypothetical protein
MSINFLETVLNQNVASIIMATVFIYYLIIKDKTTKKTFDDFNKSLQGFNKCLTNHLNHQLKADVELAKAFQQLSDLIKQLILNEKKYMDKH